MNASPVSGHGSTQYSSTGFLPQLEKELCNGGRVNRSINVSPVCVCDVRSIDQSRASSHDAASLRSISRPQSLLVQECCSTSSTLPKLLSPNDLLTPEVLENPEALAALGFGYPPGYGPPYPPLTLDVVNSLACRHRCVVSPQDLEVHEMCRSPSSNTSGFCSGSFLTGADGNSKDCPSGANSVSSSEEDKTLLQQEDAEAEFSGWSTCEFPVELKDVQKLFQLGDTALRDNGSNCSDFNALRVMFSALRILYYGDLKTLIPVVRQYARDTVSDFLLKSSVAGLTADEMIAAVTEVSEDRVTGVFIPTVPPRAPKMADVELDKFLAFWMARGAVPIVCCANFEASNERATATDSNGFSWQYRVVYGVEEGRIHVMTPVASLNLKAMWECLEAPVSLAISPKVVFGDLGDARPLGDLSDLRFLDDKLNVLGQVNYFLQLRTANSADRSPDPLLQSSRFLRYGYGQRVPLVPTLDHITVPTRMCSGILLFARSDSVALCKLLKSF
ncbi:hypothetical protein BV898_17534 [Hypsibius exemplaris]|uniref:Uncharacterized protein n=1 Tax=Hypsibius exemplaris TaxID=2072580 RepID=A0A9X6NF93_HYPEX|nr:hypothetical protein BV898_17534 [Hypsibius exemplaris]